MPPALLASLTLLCVAMTRADAEHPLHNDVESGFADELDEKYGAADQSMASRNVIRELVKFKERTDLNGKIVGSSFSLDVGKGSSILELGSDEAEDRMLNELLSDGAQSKDRGATLGEDQHGSKSEEEKVGLYDYPGRNGLFVRAAGSFEITDWLTEYKPKPDLLLHIKAKAQDKALQGYMHDNPLPAPQMLIEISENPKRESLEMDDLATAEANALVGMKVDTTDSDDRNGSDESEDDDNMDRDLDDLDNDNADREIDDLGNDSYDDDMGETVKSPGPGSRRRGEVSAMIQTKDIDPKRAGYQKRYPGVGLKRGMAKSIAGKNIAEPTKSPTISPTPVPWNPPRLLACYEDLPTSKVLPVAMGDGRNGGKGNPSSMSPQKCAVLCADGKYKLMGLSTVGRKSFCYCGHSTGMAKTAQRKNCGLPCAGAPEADCGSELYMSVYQLKPTDLECWTGHEVIPGLDRKKFPWQGYRGCSVCDGQDPISNQERWQEWGEPMGHVEFAQCISCDPMDALVAVDPKGKVGFCRSYHPKIDKIVTHTYPYFAHWDGIADFVHTKLVQKIVSPKMRSGKAVARCKLWKQVNCALNERALRKSWIQARIRDPKDNSKLPQHRFLECQTRKTIQCNKLCLAKSAPPGEVIDCGHGGTLATVFDRGLKDQLGKGSKSQQGTWCCYDKCILPKTQKPPREDGSFWCKEAALLL